ncbi:MAG: winged helix-turn-helix domain-containing protein, partial [Actinomycetota bacterium]|nr:winged helix-turn-helix domain-containing protein [Actinomycetota bacterium]
MLRYGLLGPLEVRSDGGLVRLASNRQRLLLSVLLLAPNRTVPAERLVEELWGDSLPSDPGAALRTQVSRLRRALGPAAAALDTADGGYRISLERGELDLTRFEDLLADVPGADGDDAVRLLDEALGLWRGPALAEFSDRPFAQPEAVRLEELRLAAIEQRSEVLLTLGRPGPATASLEALLAEHPGRERARGLLMEALYHDGRHTDALAVYQSWRRHLAEELGLDPSPALQRLEREILQHTLASRQPDHPAPGQPSLPVPVSSFVGREADVASVGELLGKVRLLTLWGPGGVGKTRLALEAVATVLDRYPHGVRFCDLVAVRSPGAVLRAIATTVGLKERALRSLGDQLVEHLADRRMLLVLDNCEHVAEAVATVAQRVVRETRRVDVLATSRERLGVDGEQLLAVAPLRATGPDPPAVRLFVDRARAAVGVAPEDEDTVSRICARLDGLPLAIELAAACLRGLTVAEVHRSLDQRFRVLTMGSRTDSRHRSLRAVVDWSYGQLAPAERRVFERLAVFAGRFDLGAAAVVAGEGSTGEEVAEAVLGLVDRSLVSAHRGADTTKYSLLDTLGSYGLERLAEQDALDAARDRHARWAVELAGRAAEGLAGSDEARSVAALRSSLDELRAAHAWLVGTDPELSLRLSADLHWYALWRVESEVFRWAEVAAAAAAGSRSPLFPPTLASAAMGAA